MWDFRTECMSMCSVYAQGYYVLMKIDENEVKDENTKTHIFDIDFGGVLTIDL